MRAGKSNPSPCFTLSVHWHLWSILCVGLVGCYSNLYELSSAGCCFSNARHRWQTHFFACVAVTRMPYQSISQGQSRFSGTRIRKTNSSVIFVLLSEMLLKQSEKTNIQTACVYLPILNHEWQLICQITFLFAFIIKLVCLFYYLQCLS